MPKPNDHHVKGPKWCAWSKQRLGLFRDDNPLRISFVIYWFSGAPCKIIKIFYVDYLSSEFYKNEKFEKKKKSSSYVCYLKNRRVNQKKKNSVHCLLVKSSNRRFKSIC
jgi:hypothetical protein